MERNKLLLPGDEGSQLLTMEAWRPQGTTLCVRLRKAMAGKEEGLKRCRPGRSCAQEARETALQGNLFLQRSRPQNKEEGLRCEQEMREGRMEVRPSFRKFGCEGKEGPS